MEKFINLQRVVKKITRVGNSIKTDTNIIDFYCRLSDIKCIERIDSDAKYRICLNFTLDSAYNDRTMRNPVEITYIFTNELPNSLKNYTEALI